MSRETVDDETSASRSAESFVPGFVVVFSGGRPMCRAIRLGTGVEVGRGVVGFEEDERLSRRHLRVEPCGARVRVRDLSSRNGTFVDGARVEGELVSEAKVIRAGNSVLVRVEDVSPFEKRDVRIESDAVVGPTLASVLDTVSRASRTSSTLLVRGESGSGKERIAQAFHAHGPAANGPLVPVNCATLPEGVAERLLFGARRGAYSGAVDDDGLVRAAQGGTLFLDEVGELDLDVQAKLLRVLESREVLPLGATRPTSVDVRFVLATHRDLRADAAEGRFRADLYYRIEQPGVVVPPLRARLEDLAFLAAREASPTPLHATFVEACALRPWPGNVRELLRHVRRAADVARTANAPVVLAEHLDPQAGQPLARALPMDEEKKNEHDEASIRSALAAHGGNVSATARSLGLHRNQLRRLLERFGIDPS